MSIAVYAGSFDPVTPGHLSIIRQASRIFAHLRVVVTVDPDRPTLFDAVERAEMLEAVVHDMPHVSVAISEGLVVEYAVQMGASYLVRSIRPTLDPAFETELAQSSRELAPELVTIFLAVEPDLAVVTSSALKKRVRAEEAIGVECHPLVLDRLRARLAPSPRSSPSARSGRTARLPADRNSFVDRETIPLGIERLPPPGPVRPMRGPRQGKGSRPTIRMGEHELPTPRAPESLVAKAQRSTLTLGLEELAEVEEDTRPTLPTVFDGAVFDDAGFERPGFERPGFERPGFERQSGVVRKHGAAEPELDPDDEGRATLPPDVGGSDDL
jgi:pantetheine-phosphate adenylyltransferase